MAKERNGANFVFRHMRLLIGWHVWENNRTEAWLREISSSEAAGDHTIDDKMDWYRIHSSSDGPEEMGKGIMDVNELHPALFQGSSETFLHMGRYERLRYLVPRFEGVISGRWKYCEQEGGELKVMTQTVLQEHSKKRKRRTVSSRSDASECSTSDQKQQGWRFDENDDDEEVPLQIKDEPIDKDAVDQIPAASETKAPELPPNTPIGNEDDDDDEEKSVKTGAEHVDVINHLPTVSEITTPELLQDTTVEGQPRQQITTGVASIDLNNTVGQSEDKPVKRESGTQSSDRPELESLAASAQLLKDTLLNHTSKWAKFASILKLDLKTPAGELVVAYSATEIVAASRSILKHVAGYCKRVTDTRAKQQQSLEDAKASCMPVDVVRKQEELVGEYMESEQELQAIIEKLTLWVERLRER
jgi:hypothetical protein